MTTAAAERQYLSEYLSRWGDKGYAVFNPLNKSIVELPIIYGFNNGGSTGWYNGALIAEDGEVLGGHLCSHEGYMPGDLGILEGSRPDRHELFRQKYPDGYRMDFISHADVRNHAGLETACTLNRAKTEASKAEEA